MLKKSSKFSGYKGPVVTIVMDGVGIGPQNEGNAVYLARTPVLDRLMAKYPTRTVLAHGMAVGLPDDTDMGNSEVGHNALGAGQVVAQGAKLVNHSIDTGAMFLGECWVKAIQQVKSAQSTLHFLGLFSDGNVHSHINHLKAMILKAIEQSVPKIRIHVLLDGRDVPARSAHTYIEEFESWLKPLQVKGADIAIASGGGRMTTTMDRYEADWSMVERGWKTHVLGEAKQFDSALQAVLSLREEHNADDQNLPQFVIAKDGKPIGTIEDHDAVIFFNFRGDRAIEISLAFTAENLPQFNRIRVPKVFYAGMMQYDGDLKLPANFLVSPPSIHNTMGEALVETNLTQLAISETQKFGHVTYFWNGNRSGMFDKSRETYIEIPSDNVTFDQRPWMKAAEITDALMTELKTGKYQYARVNYANGDMVGHTGNLDATIMGVEAVDLCLARLLPVIDALGGMAIITADHGNADEMYQMNKGKIQEKDGKYSAKTSHTLNPVPCILYDNQKLGSYRLRTDIPNAGIGNLAATALNLLGYEAPEQYEKSIIE